MTNSENNIDKDFNINSFTLSEYRSLIRLAKDKKYKFITYDEINTKHLSPYILWRHDCDFSLNRAYKLAVIEREEGIRSTYFVNMHCEFYNVFEKTQSELIFKILDMGHMLALHFDFKYYDILNERQLDKFIQQEVVILEMMFGVKLRAFSFHNPSEYSLAFDKMKYGGLLNTYSKQFKKTIDYVSDSNGYWRYRTLADVLENFEYRSLQVLTHPGWWQDKALPPRGRVARSIYGRANSIMCLYDKSLLISGRVNITKLI